MNLTCTTALSGAATNDSTATDLHLDISRLACYETPPQSRFQIRSNVASQPLLIFVRYYAAATGSRLGALITKIPSCQSRFHATSPSFCLHHTHTMCQMSVYLMQDAQQTEKSASLLDIAAWHQSGHTSPKISTLASRLKNRGFEGRSSVQK